MSSDSLLDELLASLLKEPRDSVVERERNLFDALAGPAKESLVLFGAGPLGRQALSGLRSAGLEPLCFADNRKDLWGTQVEGVEVLEPAEAAATYGQSACFVVTVYNGSPPRRQLRELGCLRVLSYAPLFWKYAEALIPVSGMGLSHQMWDRAEEIRRAYRILADEASRTVFREQIQWRANLDSDAMGPPSPSQETYFPPDLVGASTSDVFVDCGAFDGDSIRSFLASRKGKFEHIFALEPDPQNRERLEGFKGHLEADAAARFTVLPYAVGKRSARVAFTGGELVRSHVDGESEDGDTDCVALDEIFTAVHPTYIKMDIEGAEPDAIRGAAQVLNRVKPVLAACVYHRWEHLWEIPLLIHSLTQHHKISLRRYAEDCWELVCYAVPESSARGVL